MDALSILAWGFYSSGFQAQLWKWYCKRFTYCRQSVMQSIKTWVEWNWGHERKFSLYTFLFLQYNFNNLKTFSTLGDFTLLCYSCIIYFPPFSSMSKIFTVLFYSALFRYNWEITLYTFSRIAESIKTECIWEAKLWHMEQQSREAGIYYEPFHSLLYLGEYITLFTKFKSNGKTQKENMIKQCNLEKLNHEVGQNY